MDLKREQDWQAWKAEQAKKKVFGFKPLPEISMAGWNAEKRGARAAAYVEPEPEPEWDDDPPVGAWDHMPGNPDLIISKAALKQIEEIRQQALQIQSQPDPEWEPNPLRNPLIHALLEQVTRACANKLIFEALCKVFAETVEKFEKPKDSIPTMALWDKCDRSGSPLEDMRAAIKQIESRREEPDLSNVAAFWDSPAWDGPASKKPNFEARVKQVADQNRAIKQIEAINRADPLVAVGGNNPHENTGRFINHAFEGGAKHNNSCICTKCGWHRSLHPPIDPSVAASGGTLNVGASRRFVHHAFMGPADGGCKRCGEPQFLHPQFQPSSQDRLLARARELGVGIGELASQSEPVSECDECWGTGAYRGWGKDCSRGCPKPEVTS
jgi:hypothetical protein